MFECRAGVDAYWSRAGLLNCRGLGISMSSVSSSLLLLLSSSPCTDRLGLQCTGLDKACRCAAHRTSLWALPVHYKTTNRGTHLSLCCGVTGVGVDKA